MFHKPLRLLTVLLSLGFASAASAQDGPRVVAVTYPLQYFAERLLADGGEAVFPVPEGTDPSFWRPAIADISMIQSADLILLNGAGFATWIDRVSLPRSRVMNTTAGMEESYIVTQSITHSHGEGGEHSHEGTASYLWLDPSLAIAQAESVALALAARDLVAEEEVVARLDALRADLMALDEANRDALSRAQDVVFIATHPRYQYLARAYGLTIVSLEWEAGATPDEGQLADLAALIDAEGGSVLIWEADPDAESLAATEALGLVNVTVPPLATPPAEGDFLLVFAASVTALAEAAGAAQAN